MIVIAVTVPDTDVRLGRSGGGGAGIVDGSGVGSVVRLVAM